MIQPQVLLRLPCYDFTPITSFTFGGVLLAVRLPTSGPPGSHGVTGGVYKARERIHRGMLIDCIAVEDEYGSTPAQRAELDWLLYNKPLEYAQLVLGGEIERYLSLGCDHGRLED